MHVYSRVSCEYNSVEIQVRIEFLLWIDSKTWNTNISLKYVMN